MAAPLHGFIRAEASQGRKVRDGQPAPCRGKDSHTPQLGQFPRDMDPADPQDVSKVLLGHFDDQAGARRLIHGQKVQQIAELDPG